jgi:hypothetical protein
MTHTQDAHHVVTDDAISNNVRIRRDQLAHVSIWHGPAAMGEMHKAVTGLNKTFGQFLGGPWIEFHEVVGRARDLPQRRRRPDDTHESGFGRRNSLAFGQL